jgi:hypothetical protein
VHFTCCKDSSPLVGSWLANLVSQPTEFNDIVCDPSKCWMKTHFVNQIRQDGSCFDFGSSFHKLDFCVTCILQVMYVMSDQLCPVEEMLVPCLFKSLDLALDQ